MRVVSMIADVIVEAVNIDFFPATEFAEIQQNVKTIVTTPQGSVPLDREFGIDTSFLDAPANIAPTLMLTAIIEAVPKFESRATVKEVLFDGDVNGKLNARIRIDYNVS